jgi:pSer/pThr/pTyr-binding forkhead associated (FHA) protein
MKFTLQGRWPLDSELTINIDHYPFVIGRKSDSDCHLPLAFVSRRHCQFTQTEDNQVFVQDLESFNGTFVNGKRASSPLPLGHGDELHLGPCSFRVVFPPEREETARDICLAPTKEDHPAVKREAETSGVF